jgi:drug/metabolite transporter (DMT)-like permease
LVGYTLLQVLFGTIASIFQILGTVLMIYSATYGLAGPASAMVQSQCIIQTALAAIFLHDKPSTLDIVGIGCAVIGAIIMSVEIDFSRFGGKTIPDDRKTFKT